MNQRDNNNCESLHRTLREKTREANKIVNLYKQEIEQKNEIIDGLTVKIKILTKERNSFKLQFVEQDSENFTKLEKTLDKKLKQIKHLNSQKEELTQQVDLLTMENEKWRKLYESESSTRKKTQTLEPTPSIRKISTVPSEPLRYSIIQRNEVPVVSRRIISSRLVDNRMLKHNCSRCDQCDVCGYNIKYSTYYKSD